MTPRRYIPIDVIEAHPLVYTTADDGLHCECGFKAGFDWPSYIKHLLQETYKTHERAYRRKPDPRSRLDARILKGDPSL